MKLYQPVVEKFKYSIWKGKWVQDTLYPSTLVFDTWDQASDYEGEYISVLKGPLNLKEGNFRFYIAQLKKH